MLVWTVGDVAFVLNGGAPLSGTQNSPTSAVRLGAGFSPFGATSSGSVANACLRVVAYIPRRLANADLQTLTAG